LCIPVIGLFFLLLYFIPQDIKLNKDLIVKHSITSGVITYTGRAGKGNGIGVEYTYHVKGKQYEGSRFRIPYALQSVLLDKRFTVVFASRDPAISYLLISPQDYSIYLMEYPDSLSYIIAYYKNSGFE
jgi:hypothetical protein